MTSEQQPRRSTRTQSPDERGAMEQLTEALKNDLKIDLRKDFVLCQLVEDYQTARGAADVDLFGLEDLATDILHRVEKSHRGDAARRAYLREQYTRRPESEVVEYLADYHGRRIKVSPHETQYDKDPQPEQANILRRNFFETPYRGRGHVMLAKTMTVFEAKIVSSWLECRTRPDTEASIPWAGRCLPIIQSSGMGKSRLMRELAQVTQLDDGTPIRLTVFMLCLRKEQGKTICFPKADLGVRTYLNEHEPEYNWEHPWKLKTHAWVEAFFIVAKRFALADRKEWHQICDSKLRPAEAARDDFCRQVQKECEPIYAERKQLYPAPKDATTLQHLLPSILRTQAACRDFMASVYPDSWFVLAIDEAAGLEPGNDAAFTVEALGTIRSLFSTPLGTLSDSGERLSPQEAGPDPAQRCWLLFADTNASISALAPTEDMNPSERESNRVLERCPPVCPVTLNIDLEDPDIARQILFQLSPIQSCSWPILARGGRPLWASLSEKQDSAPGTQSPDLLRRAVGGGQANRTPDLLRSNTFVSVRFVLSKLLSPVKDVGTENQGWKPLTTPQLMALMHQRLDLRFPATRHLDSNAALTWRAAQSTRVHRHLGVVRKLPRRCLELHVETVHEPVVVQAAAGFMRSNGAPYLAQRVANMWTAGFHGFKDFVRTGAPVESGPIGEVDAEALSCMCHDLAVRRPIPGVDRKKREDPYSGHSAYVHLEDYLRQLVKWGLPELDEIVAAYGAHAWVSAQCFRRAGPRPITRQDLVQAFHERYGIVGRKNQAVWDLCIPVYCRDPTQVYGADAWSFIVVQVKARRDVDFISNEPPVFPLGGLRWREDATVSPQGNMVPVAPPIFVWINMYDCGSNTPIEVSRKATAASKLKSSAEKRLQPEYWEIVFREFSSDNHPALAGISSDAFPTLTNVTEEGPILERFVPEYKSAIDGAIDGSHRFDFAQ